MTAFSEFLSRLLDAPALRRPLRANPPHRILPAAENRLDLAGQLFAELEDRDHLRIRLHHRDRLRHDLLFGLLLDLRCVGAYVRIVARPEFEVVELFGVHFVRERSWQTVPTGCNYRGKELIMKYIFNFYYFNNWKI